VLYAYSISISLDLFVTHEWKVFELTARKARIIIKIFSSASERGFREYQQQLESMINWVWMENLEMIDEVRKFLKKILLHCRKWLYVWERITSATHIYAVKITVIIKVIQFTNNNHKATKQKSFLVQPQNHARGWFF
jgi:hypothetical protein